ncbi:MAG: hypothetical protein H5U09_04185 [Desulfomicrobiaceae bacterium]|jgi:hypothetical protein|nr:hypothetical protein [Desulfomicrobiaceae bacterium]
MVHSIDIATLLAQIPNAQQIHHLMQAHPEIFQSLAGDIVQKQTELQKDRVQKMHKGAKQSAARRQESPTGSSIPQGRAPSFEAEEDEPQRGRILDTEV